MKFINIVVEGSSEEVFVNDVLQRHFTPMGKFLAARKIRTGWDKLNNRPAKGGFGRVPNYSRFRNDILNWITSDRNKPHTWYTTFVDLYAFPKDPESPFTERIRKLVDPYDKVSQLEIAIGENINHPSFIPYVQVHEFETFIMVDPDRLLGMYPDKQTAVNRLKKDIDGTRPELVNESPHTAPSKRIIKQIPEYENQKAQVGPLVAEDIGLTELRLQCPHFDEWITKLEEL